MRFGRQMQVSVPAASVFQKYCEPELPSLPAMSRASLRLDVSAFQLARAFRFI
jgi:hypothetical protein